MNDVIRLSLTAKQRALTAAGALQPQPTGLVEFRSEGRLLVIGEPRPVAAAVELLRGKLPVYCVFTGKPDAEPHCDGITGTTLARDTLGLTGHMGAFSLTPEPAMPTSEPFDLVLDLCDPPLLSMALPPVGYFSPGSDSDAVADALQALPELVGRFEKPQFFGYDPDVCAHGASGIQGCRQCIDACPTEAIISIGDKVAVNPQLCQGGGVCVSICPTGAMTYRYPTADDSLARIRTLSRTFLEAGGEQPVLVLHGREATVSELGDDEIPLRLEELASVGIEVWLAALCYGMRAIRLLVDPSIAPRTCRELDRQRLIANRILTGLGYPTVVGWYGATEDPPGVMPPLAVASFSTGDGKRQTLYMAIDYLAAQAQVNRGETALPTGAPLGKISVDKHACTLCLACTSVCPSQALADGGDKPALRFFEGNCVQCGVCAKACPEQAISLSARVLYDPEARRRPVTLNEEEPFCCIGCGKPFATRSLIEKMQTSLANHYMFGDEAAKRRLEMCEDCRVADLMRSGAMDKIV